MTTRIPAAYALFDRETGTLGAKRSKWVDAMQRASNRGAKSIDGLPRFEVVGLDAAGTAWTLACPKSVDMNPHGRVLNERLESVDLTPVVMTFTFTRRAA